jgi:hypothetical protein
MENIFRGRLVFFDSRFRKRAKDCDELTNSCDRIPNCGNRHFVCYSSIAFSLLHIPEKRVGQRMAEAMRLP